MVCSLCDDWVPLLEWDLRATLLKYNWKPVMVERGVNSTGTKCNIRLLTLEKSHLIFVPIFFIPAVTGFCFTECPLFFPDFYLKQKSSSTCPSNCRWCCSSGFIRLWPEQLDFFIYFFTAGCEAAVKRASTSNSEVLIVSQTSWLSFFR